MVAPGNSFAWSNNYLCKLKQPIMKEKLHFKKLLLYFLYGLLILGPVTITAYFIYLAFSTIDGIIPIFSYTDAQGLLGIVKSRTLWATDYRYLNDSSEFLYARSLIEDVVAEANKEAPPGSVKAVLRDTVLSGLDKNSIGDQTNVQFLVCFSESRDQLSQWRGYCKVGDGYSLGFDGKTLRKIFNEQYRCYLAW